MAVAYSFTVFHSFVYQESFSMELLKLTEREFYFINRNFFCNFIAFQSNAQSLKMSIKYIERANNTLSPNIAIDLAK